MTQPRDAKAPKRTEVCDPSDGFYEVTFSSVHSLSGTERESDLVTEFKGKITWEGVESGAREEAGTIDGWRLQFGRNYDEGIYPQVDIVEELSSELAMYREAIFDRHNRMRENLIEEATGFDILILHSIKIHRRHRGRNLGRAATLRTIHVYGAGCGAAILKPYPLQFSGGNTPDPLKEYGTSFEGFTEDRKVAFRKMRAYWAKLGFKSVPSQREFLYLSLGWKTPRLADVVTF